MLEDPRRHRQPDAPDRAASQGLILKGAEIEIRAMRGTAGEIRQAVTCVVEGGWGIHRALHSAFTFYSTYPSSFPFVAVRDGAVVGTAAGTHHHRSGWIAHVFVAPALRGHGLGRRLTATVIERLREVGSETILLAATDLGQPVYESFGFQVESAYHEMRGPALPLSTPLFPLRPLLPADQSRLAALDLRVTGDDREPLLALVSGYGWCLDRGAEMIGAVLPTPWGATVASLLPDASDEEAALILKGIRVLGGGAGQVLVYPATENSRGREMMRQEGFEELRLVPRMVLGPPVPWLAEAVWNPFSVGLG